MTFLLIHIGYSAAVWLNDRKPLITQMGHQTFSTEQVTNMGVSIKTYPRVSKGIGYWVTAPHPLSPLRLWCLKAGRCPSVKIQSATTVGPGSLSCLAEALHDSCSGLSGLGSVWQAVPKGHPCLLFWQLLAINRCACCRMETPLHPAGLSQRSSGRVEGYRRLRGFQGTPILPESPPTLPCCTPWRSP